MSSCGAAEHNERPSSDNKVRPWIGSIEVGIKLQYERGRQKGKIGEAAARPGVVFEGRDQVDFEWGAPSTRCHVIFLILVCLGRCSLSSRALVCSISKIKLIVGFGKILVLR